METRLVSMVGWRAMRLPLSCRDSFLSESRALWELVVLGGPDLKPFGGVTRLAATFMAATKSASSQWCSWSSSGLQTVSVLIVVCSGFLTSERLSAGEAAEHASLHWKAEMDRHVQHHNMLKQDYLLSHLELHWMNPHYRVLKASCFQVHCRNVTGKWNVSKIVKSIPILICQFLHLYKLIFKITYQGYKERCFILNDWYKV